MYNILNTNTSRNENGYLIMARKCFKQHFFYKVILILIILSLIVTISMWSLTIDTTEMKKCFRHKDIFDSETQGTIIYLEDVMESKRKPQSGKSIFFHETSCSTDGIVKLNARQACAIESAAKMNPEWDVFLLFASPVGFPNGTAPISPIINALKSYPNIHLRNVNLWTYARNTPLADWINAGDLFLSKYMNSHASDFLRYLSLYKFGGTYMDLDVVVKKNLDNIAPNYSGAESSEFVAAGVMSFDHDDFGHKIAELCLNEFKHSFNGEDWGNNGPGVITRILQEICQTKFPALMKRERCGGFKVYPPNAFYAIPWPKWSWFFDPKLTNKTLELTKDSIVIHVWNKHSINKKVKVGSNVAYGLIADTYCPNVYRSCGEYF